MARDNPWRKRHPERRLTTKRTPEQVRHDLFKAGWRPSMVGLPITDGKIRTLLLELNAANRKRTMARVMRRPS